MVVDVDKISEKEMDAVEFFLREERRPFVGIRGYNPRRAVKLCQIQEIMGEFYTWEIPRGRNSRTINEVMSKIGGKGVIIEKSKLWTNSETIKQGLLTEVDRRAMIKKEAEKIKRDKKGDNWNQVMIQGMHRQLEEREFGMDIGLMEEQLSKSRRAGMLIVEEKGKMEAIYYIDAWGQYFDEVSGKQLDPKGVVKARIEEMVEVAKHKLYDKVPLQECYDETRKAPIKVRWLDINKGDELNPEYRSRLVAMELKRDDRKDLFAPTPPLESKKLLFALAVTEEFGFEPGEKKRGKKHSLRFGMWVDASWTLEKRERERESQKE